MEIRQFSGSVVPASMSLMSALVWFRLLPGLPLMGMSELVRWQINWAGLVGQHNRLTMLTLDMFAPLGQVSEVSVQLCYLVVA